MTIVTNLDLMRLEPRLFTDAADSGLTILTASDAVISDNVLTSASSDFIATGLTTDDVAVVGGEAIEILSVDDATTLSTSRRRLSDAAPILRPAPGTGLALSVISFMPMLERVESELLAAAGIDPAHPTDPLTPADVLNPGALMPAIAARVAAGAFARASAVDPASESLAALAAFYGSAADTAARLASVLVDTNGDGRADKSRRLSTLHFSRT